MRHVTVTYDAHTRYVDRFVDDDLNDDGRCIGRADTLQEAEKLAFTEGYELRMPWESVGESITEWYASGVEIDERA